jgi:hypothetical protein
MKRLLIVLVFAVLACSGPTVPTLVAASINAEPTATSLVAPQSTPTATRLVAQVTADSLHVRVRPGEHSPLAKPGYLYHADSVTLTNKCSTDPAGWAEIRWQDGTAWVNARFLSENNCQTSEEE